MKRRWTSLALAAAMLLALAAPARARTDTSLFCQLDASGAAELTLEDVGREDVYGVQLELQLEGEFPDCQFIPAGDTAYSPDCGCQTARGKTYITIYMTDRRSMSREGYVELGTLATGAGEEAWPLTAQVTLLGERLRPLGNAQEAEIPVELAAPREDAAPALPAPGELPGGETILPFADVGSGDWFYTEVQYVYGKGMMGGMTADRFQPAAAIDRAMIVTILHRMEGEPPALSVPFADVPPGTYYTGAVAWAAASGIVTGYSDGTFRPVQPITREQLAAILFRYAQYKGLDVSGRTELRGFPDAARVSPYAGEAMSWAVNRGLIAGIDGLLAPGGTATRAQAAVILYRLCVNVLGQP